MDDPHVQPADVDGVDTVDETFATLGRIVAADRRAHPDSDATAVLPDMSPMAGALLVQQLDLEPARLAAVTRRIVEAERTQRAAEDHAVLGPRAADILFGVLLDTPRAPAAYITAITE